jgi:hypothetical protein
MWNTACSDWEPRLLAGETLVPDLPLFKDEAERALRIFKRPRVPDMHGLPRTGDVVGPWLFPIVEAIFGSYDPLTNRREIQEFFWLIPNKSGKSSGNRRRCVTPLEYAISAPCRADRRRDPTPDNTDQSTPLAGLRSLPPARFSLRSRRRKRSMAPKTRDPRIILHCHPPMMLGADESLTPSTTTISGDVRSTPKPRPAAALYPI